MPSTYPGCPDRSPYPPRPSPLPPQMPAPVPTWEPDAYIPQGQYNAPPLLHASTEPLPTPMLEWQNSPPLNRAPSEHVPYTHLERSYMQPLDQHSRQPTGSYGEAREYFRGHPAQSPVTALSARETHNPGYGMTHVASQYPTPSPDGHRQVPYPQQPGYAPPDSSPYDRFYGAVQNVMLQKSVTDAFRGGPGMPVPIHEPTTYDAAPSQNHTTSEPSSNEIRQRAPRNEVYASLSSGRKAAPGNPDPNHCRFIGCMKAPIILPGLGSIEWCGMDCMREGKKVYKLKPCKGRMCKGTNPRGRDKDFCSDYCR